MTCPTSLVSLWWLVCLYYSPPSGPNAAAALALTLFLTSHYSVLFCLSRHTSFILETLKSAAAAAPMGCVWTTRWRKMCFQALSDGSSSNFLCQGFLPCYNKFPPAPFPPFDLTYLTRKKNGPQQTLFKYSVSNAGTLPIRDYKPSTRQYFQSY